jgi:hypothetical protein
VGTCGAGGTGGTSGSGNGGTGGVTGGTAGSTGGTGGATGGVGTGGATGGVSGTASGGTSGSNSGTGGGSGMGPLNCEEAWSVGGDGYVRSLAAGGVCWHGYAHTSKDMLGTTIVPADFGTCGTPCMLCANGTVAPTPTYDSYAVLGFTVNESVRDERGTVVPQGVALTVNYVNAGTSTIGVHLHGATGDTNANDRWCYALPALNGPVTIPYGAFNTRCWDNSGTFYTKQPLKAIMLVASGSTSPVPFNMCLLSATDR